MISWRYFFGFNSHNKAQWFFSDLNSRHPNVEFTMEAEVKEVIAFSDVLIDNCNNILNTTTCY